MWANGIKSEKRKCYIKGVDDKDRGIIKRNGYFTSILLFSSSKFAIMLANLYTEHRHNHKTASNTGKRIHIYEYLQDFTIFTVKVNITESFAKRMRCVTCVIRLHIYGYSTDDAL